MTDEEQTENAGQTEPRRANLPTTPRFREPYDKGSIAEEIADILAATPTDVIPFRGIDGLGATERPSATLAGRRGNDARFRACYAAGRHDADIARRMAVSRTAVGLWRHRQHPPLRPNRPFPSTEECWQYYVRGMTDAAIAAATGLALNAIRHWRYRWVLPAVTKAYRAVDEHGTVVIKSGVPDYIKYYTLGWNDAEIASAVNRTPSAADSWRRDRGLPRNVRGRPKAGAGAIHVPKASRTPRGIIPPIDALRGPQV